MKQGLLLPNVVENFQISFIVENAIEERRETDSCWNAAEVAMAHERTKLEYWLVENWNATCKSLGEN